jgi:hypothetical protein
VTARQAAKAGAGNSNESSGGECQAAYGKNGRYNSRPHGEHDRPRLLEKLLTKASLQLVFQRLVLSRVFGPQLLQVALHEDAQVIQIALRRDIGPTDRREVFHQDSGLLRAEDFFQSSMEFVPGPLINRHCASPSLIEQGEGDVER